MDSVRVGCLALLCLAGCSDSSPKVDVAHDGVHRMDHAMGDRPVIDAAAVDQAALDRATTDTKRSSDTMPPICGDMHCCVAKTCALSKPWDCMDPCSKNVSTYFKSIYLIWWSCALCSASCSADKNCSGTSSCNTCSTACQNNLDHALTDPTCRSCVSTSCGASAAVCPGLQAALSSGCP